MIAHLTGKLLHKNPSRVIVDVNGVGYELHIPLSTFYELGEEGSSIELRVYTHVREDTIALFGFKTLKEKLVFEQLTSVSGIGPRLGITILSGLPVNDLVTAIRQGNLAKLTAIPGVGRKTAERLVVDLRDKLARLDAAPAVAQTPVTLLSQQQEDVISALVNLGYPKNAAERAAQKASSELGDVPSFEELLKNALQQLSK